jgi:serine/threonine-protein kinase
VTGAVRSGLCPRCGTAIGAVTVCPRCGLALAGNSFIQSTDYPRADATILLTQGQIGRFRLLEVIGTGGFATVYRAEDTQLGRHVALKLLHAHLTQDNDFLLRFDEEARAAASLRHPNIVRVFDAAVTQDGRPYLVMELLDGMLLSQQIAERAPLPLIETAALVTQLASALDYLHQNGLIHRDLKPSNVMVDNSGVATLMDFGIVRSLFEQSRHTLPGHLVGTPTYSAPEQVTGGPLGPAVDMYALGILTYELCAGRPPFEGNTQRVLYAHAYEPPAPLENLPEAASDAIKRALEKDPEKRFPTAREFARALMPTGSPTAHSEITTLLAPLRADTLPPTPASAPVSAPPKSTSLSRRRPVLLAAGAGAAVLVIALLAFAFVRGRSGPAKKAPAAAAVATASAGSAGSQSVRGAPAAPAGAISLKVTSPANDATVSGGVVVQVEESGATIKAATDNDPNAAHYHYFVDRDPAGILKPGQPIPTGQPDIIHSASASQPLADLGVGEHHVWVVLAHTDHTPFSPNVQAVVAFKVVPAAIAVQTFAGTGSQGFADGAATAAQFSTPNGVAVDAQGNVFVADTGNSRIRRITSAGAVTTVTGSGAAQFDGPRGVAVDKSGSVYVADTRNNRIRKISADGSVTTFAGSDSPGLGGGGLADGQGSAAQFRLPDGVALDGNGDVFVADTGNNRIRKITPDGRVTTIAGSGDASAGGFADGPAATARFNAPRGIAVDAEGNVFVADTFNQRIRKITPTGVVSTLAGSGDQGTANGAAAAARFSNPDGIAIDASGNLFVTDNSSFRVRKITPAGLVIDLAGSAKEGFLDGAPGAAQFDFPAGLAVDGAGTVYVADASNNRIRKIEPNKAGR